MESKICTVSNTIIINLVIRKITQATTMAWEIKVIARDKLSTRKKSLLSLTTKIIIKTTNMRKIKLKLTTLE
jgi:hypothetical protein